ncbi:MAG: hypothetical protein JSS72_05185 [Armatimonadetes bacterium]|nr:hypothetical protein [Armatimonadota bacterium]
MDLANVSTFDDLLASFLSHRAAEHLTQSLAKRIIAAGRAIILLDGIDELPSVAVREKLRSAVIEGMTSAAPLGIRWLMTSRILGYEQVPFHTDPLLKMLNGFTLHDSAHSKDSIDKDSWRKPFPTLTFHDDFVKQFYIAPFTNSQIAQYAENWYSVRDSRSSPDNRTASGFLMSISLASDTKTLARIPNLLAMMLLVYRNRQRLPQARTQLYLEITQAYLEGIDAFRKLDYLDEFDLKKKREWLGYVGYRMQMRKSNNSAVVASKSHVKKWIIQAIKRTEDVPASAPAIADRFLDFVARRSGLLIPRSETQYSFVHLSFQEFFAAIHLADHVASYDWGRGTACDPTPTEFAAWATDPAWHETLLFLLPLLQSHPKDVSQTVLSQLFPARDLAKSTISARVGSPSLLHEANLAAPLAANEYVSMPPRLRKKLFSLCWMAGSSEEASVSNSAFLSAHFMCDAKYKYLSLEALANLVTSIPGLQVRVRAASDGTLADIAGIASIEKLDVEGLGVTDLTPLTGLQSLMSVKLTNTRLTDLAQLGEIDTLQYLSLDRNLSRLQGLGSLRQLRSLIVRYVGRDRTFSDITKLTKLKEVAILASHVGPMPDFSQLHDLVSLSLANSEVTDWNVAGVMSQLKALQISDTRLGQAFPADRFPNLTSLAADKSLIEKVASICSLEHLETLTLSSNKLSGFDDLANLSQLRALALSSTGLKDGSFITRLCHLERLVLSNNPIRDISALANLGNLRYLGLMGTNIRDLSPLRDLRRLSSISLDFSPVADLAPLKNIRSLRFLSVTRSAAVERQVQSLREALPGCQVFFS